MYKHTHTLQKQRIFPVKCRDKLSVVGSEEKVGGTIPKECKSLQGQSGTAAQKRWGLVFTVKVLGFQQYSGKSASWKSKEIKCHRGLKQAKWEVKDRMVRHWGRRWCLLRTVKEREIIQYTYHQLTSCRSVWISFKSKCLKHNCKMPQLVLGKDENEY